MFGRYDDGSGAWIDADNVKRYDEALQAWINARSGTTYDENSEAWIERLKEYMTLTVTEGAYDIGGNRIYHINDLLYIDVKPSYREYYVRARIGGEFMNPVITGEYTFGNSDKYTYGSSQYYSHDAVRWKVNGYRNGARVASNEIVSGTAYRTSTIFGEGFTKTLSGTFDTVELECVITSPSLYSSYGLITTQITNFAVDGTKYYGDQSIDT